jgi:hypothetical protein
MRISGSSGNDTSSLAEICCGDHRCTRPACTSALSRSETSSFPARGRLAQRIALRSAASARYRRHPPLAPTSRLTVDADRPSCRPIARNVSPAARPRLICSRSASDNRNPDRPSRCSTNRRSAHTRNTVRREHPTAAIATCSPAPAFNNPTISARCPTLNARPRNPIPTSFHQPTQQHRCDDR